MWQKSGRVYVEDLLPSIGSISEYALQWKKWWKILQPTWRNTDSWPFDRSDVHAWGVLASGGKDGWFVILMSLVWWAFAITSDQDRAIFISVCTDVRWVLQQASSELRVGAKG